MDEESFWYRDDWGRQHTIVPLSKVVEDEVAYQCNGVDGMVEYTKYEVTEVIKILGRTIDVLHRSNALSKDQIKEILGPRWHPQEEL